MVVVGVIIVVVSLTLPAMERMIASSREAMTINTLGGLLTNAQGTAIQLRTSVALRFEPAFRTNDLGLMVDAAGRTPLDPGFTQPVWRDHQQVRLLAQSLTRSHVFTQVRDSTIQKLPAGFWLAPGYALDSDWPPAPFIPGNLEESNGIAMRPLGAPATAAINRLESFYIVFSAAGHLVRYPAASLVYADPSQQHLVGSAPVAPWITHPDASARALLLYDRTEWDAIPSTNGLERKSFLSNARAININRITGDIVTK